MEKVHAYIAGLFDGEGCVSAQEQFIKGKYNQYPRISIQLSIANQWIPALEFVQNHFGGTVHDKGDRKSKCFDWRLVGKDPIKRFLLTILPFSIIKEEQIRLGLEFIETMRDENLGSIGLPVEVHRKRREIFDKLKMCKINPNLNRTIEYTDISDGKCVVCETIFKPKRKHAKFCSNKCQIKSWRTEHPEETREQRKKYNSTLRKEWRKREKEKKSEYVFHIP